MGRRQHDERGCSLSPSKIVRGADSCHIQCFQPSACSHRWEHSGRVLLVICDLPRYFLRRILEHDARLLARKDKLPSYFRLENPDTSHDALQLYSGWHRLYLHAAFHFTRITLHRSYLLRPSFTDRYQYSRAACLSSACADLRTKPAFRNPGMGDRLRYNISAHHLFNSALILGVIVVRDPRGPQTESISDDLQAYCIKQNADTWINDFDIAEVRVIELCISLARQSRNQGQRAIGNGTVTSLIEPSHTFSAATAHPLTLEYIAKLIQQDSYSDLQGYGGGAEAQYGAEVWSDMWSNPGYYFLEPMGKLLRSPFLLLKSSIILSGENSTRTIVIG
jgi:hypothetical protein